MRRAATPMLRTARKVAFAVLVLCAAVPLACAPTLAFERPLASLLITGGQDASTRHAFHPGDLITVNGGSVPLPLKEFELLELLLRNAGRVLTRMQLIDRIWGADYVGDTKTLDVHVKRLRSKIEPDPGNPRYLVTVRGLGYKFEP